MSNEHDDDYEKSEGSTGFDTPNQFPDGEYALEIDRVKTFKDGYYMIIFECTGNTGASEGLLASFKFYFDSTKKGEKSYQINIDQYKSLMNALGRDVPPSQMENTAVQDAFSGIVIRAKKKTNKQGYANWGYFELVSKPGAVEGDGKDEIDLDEDDAF